MITNLNNETCLYSMEYLCGILISPGPCGLYFDSYSQEEWIVPKPFQDMINQISVVEKTFKLYKASDSMGHCFMVLKPNCQGMENQFQ